MKCLSQVVEAQKAAAAILEPVVRKGWVEIQVWKRSATLTMSKKRFLVVKKSSLVWFTQETVPFLFFQTSERPSNFFA
jgi:hypothetical protein